MGIRAGDQVRHVGGDMTGVVLRVDEETVQVAFPSGTQYVMAVDLEPAAADADGLLAEGHFGDSTAAHLRLLAEIALHAYAYDPTAALVNARLEPKLHQAFVAHRVVNKVAPRMILADEVGLGKTIEAGLAIKELMARGRVERVLIITPASLSRQWQSELKSKFNESFDIMDGPAAKHLGRGGSNPFQSGSRFICSYQFATTGKRPEQIVEADWDLVVFDEAHRVRRTGTSDSNRRVTAAYRLAEELRDRVTGLLLLSATPVQLHAYELFSLIDLVEPGLFQTFNSFEANRARLPKLNELMRNLLTWEALDEGERGEVLATSSALLKEVGASESSILNSAEGRQAVRSQLVEHHPLADALIRNRKAHLGMQGERHATVLRVELSEAERDVYERVVDYLRDGYRLALGQKNNAVGFLMVTYLKMLTSSSHALRTSFRRRIKVLAETLDGTGSKRKVVSGGDDWWDAEELSELIEDVEVAPGVAERIQVEIEVLQDLVGELDDIRDSKIGALIKYLLGCEGEKVVLFTQFIETQLFLQKALDANAISTAIFNGRMSADEKEAAIHSFRNHRQVLISTESGGEGRNLQFAHVLVNYDLPWNPMKVEQRIGRLDRIGQSQPVRIVNLVCEDTLDERVIEVLAQRIRLFEESIGALEPILGAVERDIEKLLLDDRDEDGRSFDEFAVDLEKKVAEARLLERTMSDFVLDEASFRKDEANSILGREPLVSPVQLGALVQTGLEYLGGKVLPHEEGGEVISLSPRLAGRLGTKSGNWRGVFDPVEALRMDELDFFACGHPLIDKVLRQMESLPDALVGMRASTDVPPGTWVEIVREMTSRVGAGDGRLVRHLVDCNGSVTAELVSSLPLADEPVRGDPPDWVGRAVDASEIKFQAEFREFSSHARAAFDADQIERRERLDRTHESEIARMERQISGEEAWLAQRRDNPTDRERKIIPARERKLEIARIEAQRLEEEHEVAVEALMRQQIDVRARVVSAAVVVGR